MPLLETCGYVTLPGKKNFGLIKSRILLWGDYPELLGLLNLITRIPNFLSEFRVEGKCDYGRTLKEGCELAGFEDG